MAKIGITTTIPVEAVYAAGHTPVDLNNIFITNPEPRRLIERAEAVGLPSTTCAWIKGIYSSAKEADVDAVITVMGGDCSNTRALADIWKFDGLATIPFAYPHDRSREALAAELERLCAGLGTTAAEASAWKARLDAKRTFAARIDELTWRENKVTGFENHLHLVNASDFCGDPEGYGAETSRFIAEAQARNPLAEEVRLGYIGVPTILTGLYDFLESHGARVVFNETQRQFSLPYPEEDLVGAYLKFTYPYDVFARVADIKPEIERRGITGIIHYVQSFCFRQMEDVILRKTLGVPVLTLEGDRPEEVDGRTKTRLESFVEMLRD